MNKCLAMCGLRAYSDPTVGPLGVKYRKRLTIAVELTAKVRPPSNKHDLILGLVSIRSRGSSGSWMNQPPVWTRRVLGPSWLSSVLMRRLDRLSFAPFISAGLF